MAVDVFDPLFLAAAVPAVLIAGIAKGGFGAGAAFAATPLLTLVVEPAVAVGVMLPLLMVMDVTGLRAYWRRWSWPDARALMIGAVPGIALGAAAFAVVPADAVRLLIGGVALSFVAFQIARERGWDPTGGRATPVSRGLLWGAVAGFTSFVTHAGGPPAAVHLLGRRLEKTTYQATTVVAFWWVNMVKVGPYAALGLFADGQLWTALWLAPVAVGGFLAGVWAHKRVSDRLFFQVIRVLLVIVGVRLVWLGAAGLLA
ncbi:MAG: sulfite exporter TauE/SafE family protein [Pseudomonadota bacterium]